MGAEGNGLSLEGLAHRLEALERENAELRSKVAALEGSGTGWVEEQKPASRSERRVSRRALLRNAGAAAVGTMAAGALLARDASVAKAGHFAPGISVDFVVTHLETANATAVFGNAPNGEGVVGFGGLHGVRGEGQFGVHGVGKRIGAGVLGTNSEGAGVWGEGRIGVRGEGSTGVEGRTNGGNAGVLGVNTSGSGSGVLGVGIGSGLGGLRGVEGTSELGIGVRGRSEENIGVLGSSRNGYGGLFEGGKAQLRFVPKDGTATGRPTTGTHSKGEIYMDSAGTLFVCTADGSPGTWRMFQTVAT